MMTEWQTYLAIVMACILVAILVVSFIYFSARNDRKKTNASKGLEERTFKVSKEMGLEWCLRKRDVFSNTYILQGIDRAIYYFKDLERKDSDV